MYKEFFGLKEYPFQLTPDLEYLFISKAHTRAIAYMDFTVWNNDGFMVITGEVGSGKTTLIKKYLAELQDNIAVARIFQTQLSEVEFIQAVLVEFGLNPFNKKKVELLDMLNTFLLDAHENYRQTLLIVDDAQNLSVGVLEEIRMLSGLETDKEKLLNVMLIGQPELNDMLELPALEQLLQRIRLRFHILALNIEETEDYINHRLKIAGGMAGSIFDGSIIPEIYKYTGGIPRLINILFDTCLTLSYAEDKKKVTVEIIAAAIEELRWTSYDKRKRDNIKQLSSIMNTPNAGCMFGLGKKDGEELIANIERISRKTGSLDKIVDLFIKISNSLAVSSKQLTEITRIISNKGSKNK